MMPMRDYFFEKGYFLMDEKKVNQETAIKEKKEKQRGPMAPIHRFLINVLVILTLIWATFGFVFGLKTAPNNDMHPRIDQGDLMLFYRLETTIRSHDVVIFTKNDTTYVGRVVALPGETVEVTEEGSLIINDHSVIEPDIYFSTPPYLGFVNYPLTLGNGEYFILADARDGGEDSRYFGAVEKDDISGVVLAVLRRNVI